MTKQHRFGSGIGTAVLVSAIATSAGAVEPESGNIWQCVEEFHQAMASACIQPETCTYSTKNPEPAAFNVTVNHIKQTVSFDQTSSRAANPGETLQLPPLEMPCSITQDDTLSAESVSCGDQYASFEMNLKSGSFWRHFYFDTAELGGGFVSKGACSKG